MMSPVLLWTISLALLAYVWGREVTVEVTAPWKKYALDYVVEVSQYLASVKDDPTVKRSSEKSSVFWDFQRSLCTRNASIDEAIHGQGDVAALREDITASAKALLPANYQDMLDLFLDLQHNVAAVSFFNSLADHAGAPCGSGIAFVETNTGVISCSLDEAKEQEYAVAFESWEHVYPAQTVVSKSHATLYGVPGSSSLCQMMTKAFNEVETGRLESFSLRPSLSLAPAESNNTELQGYGVFLDIKNMEYKNVDDAASSASKATGGSEGEGEFSEEEIAGINFKKLYEYNEHSKKELLMLQDRLLQVELSTSDNLKEEMKVWKMKDLGLQIVQTMHSVTSKGTALDAVQYLAELVHNFPRYASRMSATKVTTQVQADVEKLYMSGASNWMPPNSLFINGLRVDLSEPSFNIFDMLQKLQEEVSRESQLAHFNLGRIYARRVYEAAFAAASSSSSDSPMDGMDMDENGEATAAIRVDVSKGGKYAVSFLNNLEKDEIYSQWPKTLKTLLYPSWSLHALSRNLYTVVVVADVFSPGGATLLQHARSMYMQHYPIRFGFVLDCEDTPNGGVVDVSETLPKKSDVCRVFAAMKDKKGVQRATHFLFNLADYVTAMEAQGMDVSLSRQQLLQLAASDQGMNGGGEDELGLSSLLSSFGGGASKALVKDLDAALSHPTKYFDFVTNSTAYLKARGLPMNSYSLNGIVVNEASLSTQTFMQILGREQYTLSNMVRANRLRDRTKNSLFTDIMTVTNAYPRYHALLDDHAVAEYVNALDVAVMRVMNAATVFTTTAIDDAEVAADEYLVVSEASVAGVRNVIEVLQWLQSSSSAADGEDSGAQAGDVLRPVIVRLAWRRPATTATTTTATEAAVEVGVEVTGAGEAVSSSTSSSSSPVSLFAQVHAIASTNPCVANCVASTVQALQALLDDSSTTAAADISSEPSVSALSLARDATTVVSKALEKDRSGQPTVVFFNGRVLPTGEDGAVISGDDLQLLRTIETKKVAKTTKRLVADLDLAMEHSAIPQASFLRRSMLRFLLTSYKQSLDSTSRRFDIGSLLQHRLFDMGLDLPTLLYHVTPPAVGGGDDDDDYLLNSFHDNLQLYVVVDPLSLAGQRAVAIMDLLVTRLRVTVNLLLTPRADITEFPLQNFYRFVLRQSSQQPALSAQFTSLPRQHVLTVRMDTPEPWNVQATRAEQDPDNLRCTTQSCGDSSSSLSSSSSTKKKEHSALGYTLKSLLVAGQCLQSTEREVSEGRFGLPPNGLQLVLTHAQPATTGDATAATAALWDTLVMQNLGYFQLQATTPGWYRVQLAPGKSSQLYRIYDASEDAGGLSTPVLGFGDKTHRLIVVKRRGMESYSLLDAPDDTMQQGQGLWNKLSSGLFGKQKSSSSVSSSAVVKHEDDDKIHVFSLASGHMYERLLRIMMLSVSRQASRPVKFWLLENYLSPAFKAMAAVMSARFGFEVAYVTYKWPHWLRHQTQQQRIIWGYKILFLDVLFPLHLKKVIYVDADQVVRADIAELWDMDLQGHAYAYTPFCASREETLGFQFWRQGYWKDHLQGRPYHISALYVVDLQRFRQQTVGDQLRATYDQLSRDPNSLANLDQDLPNYTQHAVPIFSLPQEWLWCETWCSEDSKSKAKTIDLCNNPLHKEPKLDMARRVISGKLFNQSWVQLDSEIRDVATAAGLLHE